MNSEPKLDADSRSWKRLAPEARRMRRTPTAAENLLWQSLRWRQAAGFKFRRQHAIGPFIVDFYCVKARLVIEVDGPIHDKQTEADTERQSYLEHLGLRVLRFTNDEVLSDIERVLSAIQDAAAS